MRTFEGQTLVYQSYSISSFMSGKNQLAYLNFTGVVSDTPSSDESLDVEVIDGKYYLKSLGNSRIMLNGFAIDSNLFPANKFELGGMIAEELAVSIMNYDGALSTFDFKNKFVDVSVAPDDQYTDPHLLAVRFGRFFISDVKKENGNIRISGLSIDSKLDSQVNWSQYTSVSYTLGSLLHKTCELVEYTVPSSVNNSNMPVSVPNGMMTYRQLFRYIAQLAGGFGRIRYADQYGFEIASFSSSQMMTNELDDGNIYNLGDCGDEAKLTNVTLYSSDSGVGYGANTSNTNGFNIVVSNNPLFKTSNFPDGTQIVQYVLGVRDANGTNFKFMPYNCETNPIPWVEPGDKIKLTHHGVTHNTIVTRITFYLNDLMHIEAMNPDDASAFY